MDIVENNWYFQARRCRNGLSGFMGFAKREPFMNKDCSIMEPGDVWFQFGETINEVMEKLKAEVYILFV